MALIGIDLGTTNSLVACWAEGEAKIIPNILNENLTPSVVSIDTNGEILVGSVAKERLITHPELTCANFKRFMGTSKKFSLGNFTFSPEELSSFILKTLKADAEHFLGEEISEAVISVPAYFSDAQRKATKLAGELAGLKVERLISEPTAAAIAYGLHESANDTQFLVFDLGGGTFDVSILEMFEGIMEVKSIAGDNFLGGEDFNNVLASYFLNTNKLELKNLDKQTVSSLWKQAELCKKELTNSQIGKMSLLIDGKDFETSINRYQFEKLCAELILRLRTPIIQALKDANISHDELDTVILIGGSTRMTLVKQTVTKLFNKLPFANINPDETVALGAAIQAALKERNSDLNEIILTDVCPYTLGIATYNRNSNITNSSLLFSPIIERNTPIPISIEEPFVTIFDNQDSIKIKIYQGENRFVDNNIKLGEFEIPVPLSPAGKEVVLVRFTYDINGLLEVEATVLNNGLKKSLLIENSPGSMTSEEIKERLKELEKIKVHPRENTKYKLILARGERLYQESLGEYREQISLLLAKFESILETQNPKKIEKVAEEISKIFDELERY
ncbi:molecular chaperone HscC [Clostridium sp. SHJSY1]|uniref:molecular chaperone HscC n=1 Tax=Clostridium sp. SHJSY1 TaxID=2942483 RepID=UPI0028771666|nr:molecular chaperone HscC [Clostridium sp. SHJSY1]MDS0524631.1 molecular chaperone HscC [Clostridium sp. SHJSY1]